MRFECSPRCASVVPLNVSRLGAPWNGSSRDTITPLLAWFNCLTKRLRSKSFNQRLPLCNRLGNGAMMQRGIDVVNKKRVSGLAIWSLFRSFEVRLGHQAIPMGSVLRHYCEDE